MKKTPFLLSTLALVAGTTGTINTALSMATPVSAIEATADTAKKPDIYFDGSDLYAMNEYFRIEELNFKENRMTYNVNKYTVVGGVQAQRALIVARNHEAGITEAEADEKSHSLGADNDNSWYKPVVESRVVAATNYEPKLKNYNLNDNLSDILYFAVRFGEVVTDAKGKKTLKNDFWVRGKFDYRKCIHSELFDAETMVCSTMIDYQAKTATMVAIDGDGNYLVFPEDERVMTWDEEWGKVLKERLAALDTQLTHMNTQLPAVETTLAQMTAIIKNIQGLMGELGDTQEVEQSLQQTKNLSQQVQSTYDWMLGTEQRKIMDNLRAALDDALAEIERLKQQQTDNADEILQYQQEVEGLEKEILVLQAELSKVSAQLRLETVELANTKQELAQIEAKMQEILAEKEKIMQKVQILESDKSILQAEKDKIEQDKAALQVEKDKAERDKMDLLAKITELSAKNSTLIAEKTELTMQNAALKEQNETLQTKNEALQAENGVLRAENEVLQTEKQELVTGNGVLQTQKQALVAENEALNAKIKELEASLAKKPTCTVITELQAEDKTAAEGIKSTDVEIMAETPDSTEKTEVVDVPNLGEVKTKMNFWWVFVGLVAALGVLGVYCKKRLNRGR